MKQGDESKVTGLLIFAGIILMIATNGLALLGAIFLVVVYFHLKRNSNPVVVNSTNNFMNNFDFEAQKRKFKRSLSGLILTVLVLVGLVRAIVVVPAGEVGVKHLFGQVYDNELSSGLHFVNPFASVTLMSIRTESYTMSVATNEGQRLGDDSIEALTKEGLKVGLDMTVLYHLMKDDASAVYQKIGLDYDEKVIRPEVRSSIREVIALYEAKDIYSEKRDEATGKIEEILKKSLVPRGIELESVLLRNVKLPPMLAVGIEEKLTAEQEAQKYDFILQKETKEAERKRIEAEGQRDAQKIINESLSDRYLQYLYIQNLENREGTVYVPYDMPLLKGI